MNFKKLVIKLLAMMCIIATISVSLPMQTYATTTFSKGKPPVFEPENTTTLNLNQE